MLHYPPRLSDVFNPSCDREITSINCFVSNQKHPEHVVGANLSSPCALSSHLTLRNQTGIVKALLRGRNLKWHSSGSIAQSKNSETDDFVGCIGTVRVLFMG
jgi:hypothetical protein